MPTYCRRPYGQTAIIVFTLVKYGRTDFATGIGTGFEPGDVRVSRDEAAFVAPAAPVGGSSPLPVPVGTSGVYTLTVTGADLQCQRLVIAVRDQTGVIDDVAHRGAKQWEDEFVIVETYGHPAAQFPTDASQMTLQPMT
jgi:hypothetical protein